MRSLLTDISLPGGIRYRLASCYFVVGDMGKRAMRHDPDGPHISGDSAIKIATSWG